MDADKIENTCSFLRAKAQEYVEKIAIGAFASRDELRRTRNKVEALERAQMLVRAYFSDPHGFPAALSWGNLNGCLAVMPEVRGEVRRRLA